VRIQDGIDFMGREDVLYHPISLRTQAHAKRALVRYLAAKIEASRLPEDNMTLVLDVTDDDKPAKVLSNRGTLDAVPASRLGEGELAICEWVSRVPAMFFKDCGAAPIRMFLRTDDADVVPAMYTYWYTLPVVQRCELEWGIYPNPAMCFDECALSGLYTALRKANVTPKRLVSICAAMGCDYAEKKAYTHMLNGMDVWQNGVDVCRGIPVEEDERLSSEALFVRVVQGIRDIGRRPDAVHKSSPAKAVKVAARDAADDENANEADDSKFMEFALAHGIVSESRKRGAAAAATGAAAAGSKKPKTRAPPKKRTFDPIPASGIRDALFLLKYWASTPGCDE